MLLSTVIVVALGVMALECWSKTIQRGGYSSATEDKTRFWRDHVICPKGYHCPAMVSLWDEKENAFQVCYKTSTTWLQIVLPGRKKYERSEEYKNLETRINYGIRYFIYKNKENFERKGKFLRTRTFMSQDSVMYRQIQILVPELKRGHELIDPCKEDDLGLIMGELCRLGFKKKRVYSVVEKDRSCYLGFTEVKKNMTGNPKIKPYRHYMQFLPPLSARKDMKTMELKLFFETKDYLYKWEDDEQLE